MKRLFLGFLLLVVLLVVAAFLALGFLMGSVVKRGVETAGPLITKTTVKLDGVSVLPLLGTGQLRGLIVGNPEGFKAPSAIQVGSMSVLVEPRSIFSDKVVVRSVKVVGPEITFEGGLQGNNLSKLLDNIRSVTPKSGSSTPQQGSSSAGRKIQLDDFVITGGKVNLSVAFLGGTGAVVPLPDIHLSGLGQGPEGITAAELSEKILNAVLDGTTKAVSSQTGSLGKTLSNSMSTGTVDQVEKTLKGLGNFLKR